MSEIPIRKGEVWHYKLNIAIWPVLQRGMLGFSGISMVLVMEFALSPLLCWFVCILVSNGAVYIRVSVPDHRNKAESDLT